MTLEKIKNKAIKILEEAERGYNYQIELLEKLEKERLEAVKSNDKKLLEKIKIEKIYLTQRANNFKTKIIVIDDIFR